MNQRHVTIVPPPLRKNKWFQWIYLLQSCGSTRRAQRWDFVSWNGVAEETPLTGRLANGPLPQWPSDKKHHLQPQRGWGAHQWHWKTWRIWFWNKIFKRVFACFKCAHSKPTGLLGIKDFLTLLRCYTFVVAFINLFLSHVLQGCPGWRSVKRNSLFLWLPQGSVPSIEGERVVSCLPIPLCCPGNSCCFPLLLLLHQERWNSLTTSTPITTTRPSILAITSMNLPVGLCCDEKKFNLPSNLFRSQNTLDFLMWNIEWRRSCIYSMWYAESLSGLCCLLDNDIIYLSAIMYHETVLLLRLLRQIAVSSVYSPCR